MGDKVIRTGLCADGNERMKWLFRLLAVGRIDPTPLTTHRFRFDELGPQRDIVNCPHRMGGIRKHR
jgi:threonine dehydrogenase-like Zn-dependent dehydrogenase